MVLLVDNRNLNPSSPQPQGMKNGVGLIFPLNLIDHAPKINNSWSKNPILKVQGSNCEYASVVC